MTERQAFFLAGIIAPSAPPHALGAADREAVAAVVHERAALLVSLEELVMIADGKSRGPATDAAVAIDQARKVIRIAKGENASTYRPD